MIIFDIKIKIIFLDMRMLKKYNVKGVRVFVRVEIVGGQVLIL